MERLTMKPNHNVKLYQASRVHGLSEAKFDGFFFPGGEPHVNALDSETLPYPDWTEEFVIEVKGGSMSDLFLAILLKNVLMSQFDPSIVALYIPYFPGARQDKARSPYTLAEYARIVNLADFNFVLVADPHSAETVAKVDRCRVIEPADFVPAEIFSYTTTPLRGLKKVVVIAPDAGAVSRAESVAKVHGLEVIYAEKKRDADNNFRVSEYAVPDFQADVAVVIDDICDGGGTFLALADAITGVPAGGLRLWTTHGIYSKGTDPLSGKYSMIGSTNSMPGGRQSNLYVDLFPHLQSAYRRFFELEF